MTKAPERTAVRVAAFLLVLTLAKALVACRLEPTSHEAYYWLYGRHPALGYYDHPGMIGWILWLSTALFGDGPFGLRALTLLCGSASAGFVFLAARRLYDEKSAALAAALVAMLPVTLQYGSSAEPDAPLFLFWSAAFWALTHAVHEGGLGWWSAAGAFMGLAMDSKYTAVFLPAGTLLFLAASPEHRRWLSRPEPYVGALLCALAFSPTLIWNARNGWQSLRYQGVERFEEASGFSWANASTYPLKQLLVVTPIVALWAWGTGLATLARWRAVPWPDRLATSLGIPILLFFALVSLTRDARSHWPAPGYLSLVALASARASRADRWIRLALGGTGVALAAGILLLPAAVWLVPDSYVTGWKQLADLVRPERPDFVLVRDYHEASHMAYHLRPLPACDFTAVGLPRKSFRNWWDGRELEGRDAVAIWDARHYPQELERVRGCFQEVGEPVRVRVRRFFGREEEFVLVRARNYHAPGR
jgi:4-amino-4-deoxy-L-arabinose transferase-like glycosyltransferase